MKQIDIRRYLISVRDGIEEQDYPQQCPNEDCRRELTVKDIVGWGDYPTGGYRNSMKPYKTTGIYYECPSCFLWSVHHSTIENIESALYAKEHYEIIERNRGAK